MVEATGHCADRAEQQPAGSEQLGFFRYPSERSWAGTDPLILSGRLDTGSLVAFEVTVEQLALTALPSVRMHLVRVGYRRLDSDEWRCRSDGLSVTEMEAQGWEPLYVAHGPEHTTVRGSGA